LHKTGVSLQFSPEKCVKIIGACFRLHNKALDDRLPLVVDGQIPILDNNHIVDAINNINQAHAIRQRLIHVTFFEIRLSALFNWICIVLAH
jgi:hypothetical protein